MMNNDLILVIGLVVGVLSIPAIASALSNREPPRVAAFAVVVSGGMIIYALYNQPGGYSIDKLPQVITRVVASIIR